MAKGRYTFDGNSITRSCAADCNIFALNAISMYMKQSILPTGINLFIVVAPSGWHNYDSVIKWSRASANRLRRNTEAISGYLYHRQLVELAQRPPILRAKLRVSHSPGATTSAHEYYYKKRLTRNTKGRAYSSARVRTYVRRRATKHSG